MQRDEFAASTGLAANTQENQRLRFKEAGREQVSLLSGLEKRCLVYLALRTPPWIKPDHLTALGIAAQLAVGLSYWYASRSKAGLVLASIFIALNWLGDSLDGTLARVRDKQRPRYGFYVDHVIDTFGALFLLGGLALSGYIGAWVAAGVLIAFYMLSIETYLATYTVGTFQLSRWKFSPTELRVLLILGNATLAFRPVVNLFGSHFRLFDVGGAIAIAGMAAMLLYAVARHTACLYRAERVS